MAGMTRARPMRANLARMDVYENGVVPDGDMEVCLKVIRTVRNHCLGPHFFDADGAVVLSHAHAKLVELTELAYEGEDEERAKSDETGAAEGHADPAQGGVVSGPADHERPDPDFAV